jgi:hypothetical protein
MPRILSRSTDFHSNKRLAKNGSGATKFTLAAPSSSEPSSQTGLTSYVSSGVLIDSYSDLSLLDTAQARQEQEPNAKPMDDWGFFVDFQEPLVDQRKFLNDFTGISRGSSNDLKTVVEK